VASSTGGHEDVWTYDIAASTLSRLTTDGGTRPEWTPDGQRIAFRAVDEIRWQPWDGSGTADILVSAALRAREISFGPPHTFMVIRRDGGKAGSRDLLIAPSDSPQAIRPFLATPADERNPRVSPDGHLLAYASNESGRHEVYVRPIPGPGGRIQVSTSGGEEPVWSRTGTELFYRAPRHLMAARIRPLPTLAVLSRDTLFEDVFALGAMRANYDVFPGDDRFVMVENVIGESNTYVVVNWTEDLKRKLRTSRSR
jgi:eukaryotic-like serine/threonine-protein kinase